MNLSAADRYYLYEMRLESAVTRPGPFANHDRELVDRMAGGDESALGELYVSHGRRLLAYAFRITRSLDRAEEVVQDSLLAAWRATRTFRGDGTVLAWLLGIVRNQSLNAIRRKQLRVAALDEAGAVQATTPRPDARIDAREREQAIRVALARLSPDHREVLDLVFFHGLSLAEVARVCRCPVGTVKSRLNAAKARLRQALGERDAEQQS